MQAKNLKNGDVFDYNGDRHVAIDSWLDNYIWTTSENIYQIMKKSDKSKFGYGYTSACPIFIKENEWVQFIKNIN